MTAAGVDLTGRWTGFFNYPASTRAVDFEAVLRDDDGRLTGTTTEPGDTLRTVGGRVTAQIDGRRDGHSVGFVKIYDAADGEYDLVHYSGTVEPDGNEIGGRWEIQDGWSGSFLMVRSAGAAQGIEEEVPETVGSAA